MNEFTISRIQKETEQESLAYFLEAYESATGEAIKLLEPTERPDFICIRENGSVVGVELVNVRREHPNDILLDRIVEKLAFMSHDDALEMIQRVGAKKERKRKESDWKHPEATILLIELWDIPLANIERSLSPKTLPDLYATGFKEIWLADFTELTDYDCVELFCIRPEMYAGYHPREFQKPFG